MADSKTPDTKADTKPTATATTAPAVAPAKTAPAPTEASKAAETPPISNSTDNSAPDDGAITTPSVDPVLNPAAAAPGEIGAHTAGGTTPVSDANPSGNLPSEPRPEAPGNYLPTQQNPEESVPTVQVANPEKTEVIAQTDVYDNTGAYRVKGERFVYVHLDGKGLPEALLPYEPGPALKKGE